MSHSLVTYISVIFPHFDPSITSLFIQSYGITSLVTCISFFSLILTPPSHLFSFVHIGAARYGMEVQRLCHVLDTHLSTRTYIVGEEYSIADIVCYPWFAQIRPPNGKGSGYPHPSGIAAADFLSTDQYKNLNAWADRIAQRQAVNRGMQVCPFGGKIGKPWLTTPSK